MGKWPCVVALHGTSWSFEMKGTMGSIFLEIQQTEIVKMPNDANIVQCIKLRKGTVFRLKPYGLKLLMGDVSLM